ncbi:CHAT domain-containing protein [Kibdelosporangium persicum]|uniref:CHAT domain-containing protein n=1 Tax=Kibdelosporangium persicum TaxID=2698649 RepID=A0ABX2FDF1_9PSEU|nr:CHAT domain-containing protein [Kibdelosporangium persicum]NRN69387.1 hypothetical protein [Kibdelosporangium persicum]
MTDPLTAVIAEEQQFFEDEVRRAGIDGRLALVKMKDGAVSGYGGAAVPVLPVPIALLPRLLQADATDRETLAAAVAESIKLLRPYGKTALLGAALSVRVEQLRLRAHPEELLAIAIEAVQCFAGPPVARLRGRCLIDLGTVMRDAGAPYDALIAYDKAEVLLSQAADEAGLAALAYHRAVIARSAGLYEEGLLHLDVAGDVVPDVVVSEKAICLFESGDVTAAAGLVDTWVAEVRGHAPTFNHVLPYSMRARIRLRRNELDSALEDLTVAVETAGDTVRRHLTRRFRSSDRAQLQPVFDQALHVALTQGRADVALGVLFHEKSVMPGRLRPGPSALDSEIAAATKDLARAATNATIMRDLDAARQLSHRAGDLVDHADLLAGNREQASAVDMTSAVRRLQQGLRPGETVIEYVAAAGTIWAIAVRADGVSSHRIRLHEIEAALLAQSTALERLALQSPHALERLGRALLDPVREYIVDAGRLYVVLPQLFQSFPLHAVMVDGVPLVTRTEVVYLPSVDFLEPAAARPQRGGSRVMAVDEPCYEVLPRLTAAANEVERVAARLGTTDILRGEDATAAAFLTGLAESSLLHVTSHAAFEPQAPLLARLLLADRPVFAFEIALATASATAVNLSGCSTAAQLTAPRRGR